MGSVYCMSAIRVNTVPVHHLHHTLITRDADTSSQGYLWVLPKGVEFCTCHGYAVYNSGYLSFFGTFWLMYVGFGMEMNIIKTKSMVVSRKRPVPNISISVEGKPIQQVDSMVYLGYMATEDGKCDKEIKRRIVTARTAFESMVKILT